MSSCTESVSATSAEELSYQDPNDIVVEILEEHSPQILLRALSRVAVEQLGETGCFEEGGRAAVAEEKAFDLVSRPALSAFLRERLGDSYELRIWQKLLASSTGSLETPWGVSELSVQRGIRQGSVESPLFFACLAEMTVEKTAERFHWKREDTALPGLHLSEALFVDDSILWNSSLSDLGLRTEQWAHTLAECGLRINIEKCALYVSPFHRGGRSITVQGVTLKSGEHLNVMGLQLSVTGTTCRMLAGLLARARDTFWSMKNLLLSDAPIHARIRLMHTVVGGCGLWCISAFFPDQSAQHLVNTFQMQLIISMLKIRRRPDEGWLQFRKRSYRTARAVLWQGQHRRWSSVWCERHWLYLGHLARSLLHDPPPAAGLVCAYRNREWWLSEQAKRDTEGVRHAGKFFPRLMLAETHLDTVAGGPWRFYAQDRAKWAGLVPAWVRFADVPWSSGRQLALAGD
ncbi:unnamed protein product [Symbiodinium sp. CCMP2592]|nr:unnamed protein product [Symbiodinium sp. CCMP2592]